MAAADFLLSIDVGGAAVSARYARPPRPDATVVVAHGAGAGMDHPFLRGFTSALNDDGVATLRFNLPYREAGRKFPDRPPAAIAAWRAAMDAAALRSEGEPLWAAGKSFGGRMAPMAAAEGMKWRKGADHSFAVAGAKRTPEQTGADLAAAVTEFIRLHTPTAPAAGAR